MKLVYKYVHILFGDCAHGQKFLKLVINPHRIIWESIYCCKFPIITKTIRQQVVHLICIVKPEASGEILCRGFPSV